MNTPQGRPCWYELGTSDLAAAAGFYGHVFGWSVADAGMPGFTYHLASAPDGVMVAGMMSVADQEGAPPPNWVIYYTTTDCDASAADVKSAGGVVMVEPSDIPDNGRFAMCADPQGAAFGLMQPLPRDEPPTGFAFDQSAAGHGGWNELASSDPAAAFDFYSGLFGWTRSEAYDMGPMGTYQVFKAGDAEIGGMMGLAEAPVPMWLAYFGVDDVDAAVQRIDAAGGSVSHGPAEVPGGAHIVVAVDPQGAVFALLGPRGTG